jgi:uncharacterized protein YbjT (DUF2867 family)
MEQHKKIAVAGATGRVGRHVVDVLEAAGHEVVPMSRSQGVDIATGAGLADALTGVDAIVDAASNPSPDEREATEFFVAAAESLQREGARAGVRRIVAVSIVGIDRFPAGGYLAAKVAHERALRAGPLPVVILRATQFHEFVGQVVQWGTQGDVAYVPRMQTQLVAARTVAERLVELAFAADPPALSEIAGPRPESSIEAAKLLVGDRLRIEAVPNPTDAEAYENGGLLPGPDATLAGPTFAEWLESSRGAMAGH